MEFKQAVSFLYFEGVGGFIAMSAAVIFFFFRNSIRVEKLSDKTVSDGPKTKIPEATD